MKVGALYPRSLLQKAKQWAWNAKFIFMSQVRLLPRDQFYFPFMSPPLYFSKKDWSVTNSLRDAFLLLPDGEYKISIEKVKRIRSPEHNRLYWSILQIIDTYSSQGTDDLHKHFKKEFLKPRYVISTLDRRRRRKLSASTAVLNTEEFGIYNKKVMVWWQIFFAINWKNHWFREEDIPSQ